MNRKEVFLISLTIFLTAVAWMILDVYKIKQEVVVSPEVFSSTIIKYKIDPHILDVIKTKIP